MRRPIVLVVASLVLLSTGLVPVAAQDASPVPSGSLLAGLGYPEFRVVVSDEGTEAPTEVAAGRYLVVLENGTEDEVDVTFVKTPAGETVESLRATPPAEGEEELPPGWFYETEIAGGAIAPPGGVGMAVIDLTAGEWFIDVFRVSEEEGVEATPEAVAATPEAEATEGGLLTVTGDAASPAAVEEPAGAVTVEMQDFAFNMPEQLPAGPQVWEVTNTGQEPHHIALVKGPDDLTMDDVMAILEAQATGGTPPPGVPDPETDFEDVAETSVLSAGKSTWLEFDLAPGTYVALCFVPNRETGLPHAAMGMVQLFTVADAGAPGATPAA